jgi:hypothetical protein
MLPTVTADHIARAKRMIGCGLDVEEVSQWLATHEADRAKVTVLEADLRLFTGLYGEVRRFLQGTATRQALVHWVDAIMKAENAKERAKGAKP